MTPAGATASKGYPWISTRAGTMTEAKSKYQKINETLLIPLLSQMIQTACVNDGHPQSGQEIRNAQLLKRFFEERGLDCQEYAMLPGRTSLMVRVKGTDPKAPSLMFMGHTDVVPADPKAWKVDPFSGQEIDGEIWGRGALDMLNWTASEAVGFAQAVQEHGPFPGDLIFLALADEEAAGRYGARFLTEEHWPEVACDYMVTELGDFSGKGMTVPRPVSPWGKKGSAGSRSKAREYPVMVLCPSGPRTPPATSPKLSSVFLNTKTP
jgi:acetylornithine deacetylase/succinyl-diaminopimelate desuccinylase-like protein